MDLLGLGGSEAHSIFTIFNGGIAPTATLQSSYQLKKDVEYGVLHTPFGVTEIVPLCIGFRRQLLLGEAFKLHRSHKALRNANPALNRDLLIWSLPQQSPGHTPSNRSEMLTPKPSANTLMH